MRICFTSDLHGNRTLFQQLEELLRRETPDLLILGGDLMADGAIEDPVQSQIDYVEREFIPLLKAWKTANPALTIACLPGNHEWSCTRDVLRAQHEMGTLALLAHDRVWEFNGVNFLGYGCTPPTPHTVKDFERLDMPDSPPTEFGGVVWDPAHDETRDAEFVDHFARQPSLAEELSTAVEVSDPWIFVAHAPPIETKLDRLPEVSYPIGSRAVREFIERRQPLCSLHGHVHESPLVTKSYTDRLGRTLCINPGQGHEQLHAVLFDPAAPADTLKHTVYS